ncbi:MAG: N-acetyl-alpha-D-glucosaminyl L-malate synthase BshA [Ignavibacteriales bacterium]|nr:N-acetyl-alpha-D-glucosaminyl L-malate synthase BshA [Ignavibacteriales bacterium]
MNIGITCYPTYGGSGVVATELGKALADKGHSIHFISYAMPMRLGDAFRENIMYHEVEMSNYPVFDFPLYTLALASKMVEVASYEAIDIFHCHYAIPHATSAYLAKQILNDTRAKIITTLHGTDITLVGLEPSFLPVMKFSIEQSDGVTAVSRFLKEKTLTNYAIHKEIEVIPNFVDTNKYRRTANAELLSACAPHGEKLLVHTSNFRPVKRVADVIHIFHEVRKKVPARLMLIGDGPDRSHCEMLARDLGIAEHVKFLGKQAEIINILSISDLFLMPSQSESFGLSALEAMACEVPVISTSVGGLHELQLHGQTGYIAEIGDIDRMARYAVELLSNPSRHRTFAQAARTRALEFELSRIVGQYEQYYQKILSGAEVSA